MYLSHVAMRECPICSFSQGAYFRLYIVCTLIFSLVGQIQQLDVQCDTKTKVTFSLNASICVDKLSGTFLLLIFAG